MTVVTIVVVHPRDEARRIIEELLELERLAELAELMKYRRMLAQGT